MFVLANAVWCTCVAVLFSCCQAASDDKLAVGRLAHEGAIFLKLSQEGIEMERELFMGPYFRSHVCRFVTIALICRSRLRPGVGSGLI